MLWGLAAIAVLVAAWLGWRRLQRRIDREVDELLREMGF